MLEKFQYINHMNESLDFGEDRLFVNENDLHDFAWEVASKNDRISGFKRGIVNKTIPILLKCNTEEEGVALRNRLFEVLEKDVLAVKHGKIILNGYYLECFAVESKKSEYLIHDSYMKVEVKISTDKPSWIKETSSLFNYGYGSDGKNLDYNRDVPYDYTSNLIGKQLNNTNFVPSNFRLNIFGICGTPVVNIAGHPYKVSVTVEENEYLTIDSANKTIVLTKADGTQVNCFNLRDRDSYVFEKIPVGLCNVSCNGSFTFEIVLLEERSEPKWI